MSSLLAADGELEWSLDPAQLQPPDSPLRGRFTGCPEFIPDTVQTQSGSIDFQKGVMGQGNCRMSIFFPDLNLGDDAENKSVRFAPAEATNGRPIYKMPRVNIHWNKDSGQRTGSDAFTGNFALVLETGTMKDGAIPAKIYLCLPDEAKSVLAGTFKITGPGGTPLSMTAIHGDLKMPAAVNEAAISIGSLGPDAQGKTSSEGCILRLSADGELPSGNARSSMGGLGSSVSVKSRSATYALKRRQPGWHLVILAAAEVRKEPERKPTPGFAPFPQMERTEPVPRIYELRWVELKDARSRESCPVTLDPGLTGSATLSVPGVRDGAIVSYLPVSAGGPADLTDYFGVHQCLRVRVKDGATEQITLPQGEYEFRCEGRRKRIRIEPQVTTTLKLMPEI